MKISVVIANRNGQAYLGECLASVARHTRLEYELWLVDNASEDGGFEQARKRWGRKPGWHFLALKRDVGPVAARNLAARQARGKYLLFLDSDTVVGAGWLPAVVRYLDEHSSVGGGQLKLRRWDRPRRFDSAGDKITRWGFLVERAREAEDRGQFDKPEPVISGKMAAIIVRRRVFELVGGLDEALWMYWEEPDLGWRIWKAGYAFEYLPMGVVAHKYGSRVKPVEREWERRVTYLGCRNQLAVIAKNGVGWARWRMLLGVMAGWLGLVGLMLGRGQFSRAGAVMRAWVWLGLNAGEMRRRRQELRERLGKRFDADGEWWEQVVVRRSWRWYLGKGINYVLGRPF